MKVEKKVFLLIGGNIEPRKLLLEQAESAIKKQVGVIVGQSSIYESEPWGFHANTFFLNKVLRVATSFEPEAVLTIILEIEKQLGRQRNSSGFESRTIDIDILYYDNEIVATEKLIIPHPRLQERKFALLPLVEIAANFTHPVLRKTNSELLKMLIDKPNVWKL